MKLILKLVPVVLILQERKISLDLFAKYTYLIVMVCSCFLSD
jgi:hypothetical protein